MWTRFSGSLINNNSSVVGCCCDLMRNLVQIHNTAVASATGWSRDILDLLLAHIIRSQPGIYHGSVVVVGRHINYCYGGEAISCYLIFLVPFLLWCLPGSSLYDIGGEWWLVFRVGFGCSSSSSSLASSVVRPDSSVPFLSLMYSVLKKVYLVISDSCW